MYILHEVPTDLENVFAIASIFELTLLTRIFFHVTDLAYTNMFRQEGVTTYSQLLFDVARQQVVVGARYVFSSQICLQLPSRDLLILSETAASHAILENRDNICFISFV